jgi:hypothetical protein
MVDLMVKKRNETNDDKRHQTKGKVKERGRDGDRGGEKEREKKETALFKGCRVRK